MFNRGAERQSMRPRILAVICAVLALVLFEGARNANSRKLKEQPGERLAQAGVGNAQSAPFDTVSAERNASASGCGPDVYQETFRNPPEIRSRHGALSTTLTIRREQLDIAGQNVVGNFYNDLYIPPTLRV